MLCELDHALDQIESDQNVRALILTGAGERAFSAGTDISEIAGIDEDAAIDVSRRGQAVCERLERFKVPVIAAVSGIAAGGGFELALACHMRLASPDAKFSLPESKIGLIPAYGGTQRLSRVIGSGRALELMISPRTIDSDEAARIGLVNRVVEKDLLMMAAETVASGIAKLAPLAIRACMEAVIVGSAMSLEEGLALEAQLFSRLFATEDVREGTSAFLEKREPVFKGR